MYVIIIALDLLILAVGIDGSLATLTAINWLAQLKNTLRNSRDGVVYKTLSIVGGMSK